MVGRCVFIDVALRLPPPLLLLNLGLGVFIGGKGSLGEYFGRSGDATAVLEGAALAAELTVDGCDFMELELLDDEEDEPFLGFLGRTITSFV